MRRSSGFTLIEVLTVISIILVLASALIVAVFGLTVRARKKATKALIKQIEMAASSYYDEFEAYPPDGYDSNVTDPAGNQLKGSSALLYYLGWQYASGNEIEKTVLLKTLRKSAATAGSREPKQVAANGGTAYLGDELRKENIRIIDGVACIVDAWHKPLLYDNILNGDISSPGTPDPRNDRNGGRAFHPDGFDLWSRGPDGVKKGQSAEDDIIREDAKE
ncbi:MAG: prepilin-type N-terminal cleavage/methylation domain-containing protein [Planctomycetota bacterium]|jgi:prepilin-type N-terminal cleavage/methylation domain-containing protein